MFPGVGMLRADFAGGHPPVGKNIVDRAIGRGQHRPGRPGAGIQVGQVFDDRRLAAALAAVIVGPAALGRQQRIDLNAGNIAAIPAVVPGVMIHIAGDENSIAGLDRIGHAIAEQRTGAGDKENLVFPGVDVMAAGFPRGNVGIAEGAGRRVVRQVDQAGSRAAGGEMLAVIPDNRLHSVVPPKVAGLWANGTGWGIDPARFVLMLNRPASLFKGGMSRFRYVMRHSLRPS